MKENRMHEWKLQKETTRVLMMSDEKKIRKIGGTVLGRAFKDSLPVLTGYIVLGFGFGLVANSEGYGVMLAVAMSVFIYAGSMQYAAIGLFSGGASLASVALTALLVNARHIFYGITMLDKYKNTGAAKPYLVFSLTDETYSLVCTDMDFPDEESKKQYYFSVSLLNHLYWICGTVLGVVVGRSIEFSTKGIDFALTALFLTIFTEQWLSEKKHFSALTGLGVSALCLLLFGKEIFLVPSMLGIAVVLGLYDGGRESE